MVERQIMDEVRLWAGGISYAPCPPKDFCGRHEELEKLQTLIPGAGERGQVIMISGPTGIGKSSLLNRLAYDLQDRPGGPQSLVIRAEIFEPPRMIFSAFRKLLYDLEVHATSGWFQNIFDTESVMDAVRYTNDLLNRHVAPVEPVGLLPKTGEEIIGVFARSPEIGYDRVRKAFVDLLQGLSRLMAGSDRIIAILLDDMHLASRPDRRLLLDIIRDLPPGVLLVFTSKSIEEGDPGYAEIRERIQNSNYSLLTLHGMKSHEIQEMGKRRFGLSLGNTTTTFLEEATGDPFSLMAYFNTLRYKDLAPSVENIERLLEEGKDPAALAFDSLPDLWKIWAEEISVLNPPFPIQVIACMLDQQAADMTLMMNRLQESSIFRRLPGGGYTFAHPLLHEYCSRRLSAGVAIALNARAADCLEILMHRLPVRLHVLLSLVRHYFNAQDYAKVAELSLELGVRFYHRDDYESALLLTEWAITSAEHLSDDFLLTVSKEQRELIRQKVGEAA